MIDKTVRSPAEAVAGIADGATIMIGGFGVAGMPSVLIDALIAAGKETRMIDGRGHVLDHPIHADCALIRADRADRWGNLVYRKTARNFGPVMATAAKCTVAEVRAIVPLGTLDPEAIVTPGIFVDRVFSMTEAR